MATPAWSTSRIDREFPPEGKCVFSNGTPCQLMNQGLVFSFCLKQIEGTLLYWFKGKPQGQTHSYSSWSSISNWGWLIGHSPTNGCVFLEWFVSERHHKDAGRFRRPKPKNPPEALVKTRSLQAVKFRRLKLGDYLWLRADQCCALCIERKTLGSS